MMGWSIPIDRVAEKMGASLDDACKRIAFELFSRVVKKSPVGNPSLWAGPAPEGYVGGRFRANWNCTFNNPDISTSESTDQSRGNREAAKALNLPTGGIVYLANGLPYGRRLEYEGWSSQAPAGMVRLSLTEVKMDIGRFLK